MALTKNDSKKIAVSAARIGDEKHASPITVLDLCGRSSLADFVVIMTVESVPQLEAAEEEIVRRLKQEGVYCVYRDGMRSRSWKVMDYGSVLVHVMETEAAGRFTIGELYTGAKQVEWRTPEVLEAIALKEAAKKVPEAPVKKAAAKKAAAKKAPAKKATAKKAPAKKAPAKKAPAKKAPAKKAAAKKATEKKAAVKKAAPKKAVKKAAAKKPAAKKSVKKAAKKK